MDFVFPRFCSIALNYVINHLSATFHMSQFFLHHNTPHLSHPVKLHLRKQFHCWHDPTQKYMHNSLSHHRLAHIQNPPISFVISNSVILLMLIGLNILAHEHTNFLNAITLAGELELVQQWQKETVAHFITLLSHL